MENTRASILLVDDEPLNLQILAQGLSEEHQVLMASGGQQAMDIAIAQRPDLILLDIDMPDVNGYEVCRTLKNNPKTRHIPLIFITGHDSEQDELKGLQMGAADYFTKPFKMPLVLARVAIQLELKRKTDLLEKLVDLDGLTQIPNRRRFDQVFDEEWRRAVRSHSALSLCILDVDYFKQYNDTYGHAKGDQCLRNIAAELESTVQRAGDFIARYGGEEFVLVLPDNEYQQALDCAEKLRDKIAQLMIPHSESQCSEFVTISCGVATMRPDRETEKSQLFSAADEQLYSAKSRGRNQVCATVMIV